MPLGDVFQIKITNFNLKTVLKLVQNKCPVRPKRPDSGTLGHLGHCFSIQLQLFSSPFPKSNSLYGFEEMLSKYLPQIYAPYRGRKPPKSPRNMTLNRKETLYAAHGKKAQAGTEFLPQRYGTGQS